MQEFIESFGKNNLIIILAVICAIILALFIIILIEKIDRKRREKNEQEIEYYEEPIKDDEEIIYIDEEPTKEEAKQFLEEVQKKLKEESDLIGPTHFEKEQEEKSIISYDELKKAANNIDETNDKLLEDEGEEPITIEELYKKQKEVKEEQEETKEIEQPIQRQIKEEKKFRNSEVISPVFGIYKQEEIPFRKVSTTKPKSKDIEDIENEIKKTEQFLEELKKLKDKLD